MQPETLEKPAGGRRDIVGDRFGVQLVLQEGEDRRQRHVVLTPKGKAKCREGVRAWQTAQDRFEEVLGRSEANALRSALLGIAYNDRLAKLKD